MPSREGPLGIAWGQKDRRPEQAVGDTGSPSPEGAGKEAGREAAGPGTSSVAHMLTHQHKEVLGRSRYRAGWRLRISE